MIAMARISMGSSTYSTQALENLPTPPFFPDSTRSIAGT